MRSLFILPALLAASCLVGCGGGSGGPAVASVSGKVTVDGSPGAGLTVEFHPDASAGASGPMSTGVTGEDGSFELRTPTGQLGAVIGKHKVLVKCPWRLEGNDEDVTATADGFGSSEDGSDPPPVAEDSGGAGKKCNVNPRFEGSDTTTLTAEVPEGGVTDLVLPVTSD